MKQAARIPQQVNPGRELMSNALQICELEFLGIPVTESLYTHVGGRSSTDPDLWWIVWKPSPLMGGSAHFN